MSVIDHPPPPRWSSDQSINRQLHDLVVPQLFVLSTGLTALQRRPAGDGADALMEDLSEVAASALADLRRISRGATVHDSCDLDRVASRLRLAANTVSRLTDCVVELTVEGDVIVPAGLEDDLVAVLWEGMANAIRHGGATRVDVSLSATDACLSLVVADNGTWLWPTDSASTGLTGLRERAVPWRGSLVVDHGDEHTRIEFRVPLGAMGVPHTRR